ncbi:MAG: hypothetical protein IT288_00920, partial [Bdellovibrionales bacterium]|nr:hypothetical protein [Bdellovibrionales bacterium]
MARWLMMRLSFMARCVLSGALFCITFSLIGCDLAFASSSPSSLTYQGRIIKPDTTPLEAASVDFTVSIYNPAGTCLLFQETHNLDMTGSEGTFALPIGLGTPTGATPNTLAQTLSNAALLTGAPACNYNPVSGDTRSIVVSFNDGTGSATLAAQQVRSVPYAAYASSLEGLSKTGFVQTSANITQVKVEALLTDPAYTALVDLAGGTSTVYAKASDLPVASGVLNLTGGGKGVKVNDTPVASDHAVNKNYADAY